MAFEFLGFKQCSRPCCAGVMGLPGLQSAPFRAEYVDASVGAVTAESLSRPIKEPAKEPGAPTEAQPTGMAPPESQHTGMAARPVDSAVFESVVTSEDLTQEGAQAEMVRLQELVGSFRRRAAEGGAPCLYMPLHGDGPGAPARFIYNGARRHFCIASHDGTILHPPVLMRSVTTVQRARRFVTQADEMFGAPGIPEEVTERLCEGEVARAVMILYSVEAGAEGHPSCPPGEGQLLLLEKDPAAAGRLVESLRVLAIHAQT